MEANMKREVNSVLKGAFLTVAMRWVDRLIALVNSFILARLLMPEDFGITSMALLSIGLADMLLNLGVHVALIQNRNATQAHYNSAWTLRLIQTTLATIGLILISPLIAGYFHEPRVQPVLQAMAFLPMLNGFQNIGVIAFQKHMQFGAEFRFLFYRRIAGFVLTTLLAWLLRSYWALVIGALVGTIAGVVLSYLMHPMRPRLSLEKFKEIFAVSQWMLFCNVGNYFQLNLHKVLVGHWSPATTMGAYTLADDISVMPSSELLAPLNRVFFPAFAAVREYTEELKRKFLLAQAVQTLVAIPAAVGLALVAKETVLLLLGEKWASAIPFIQVLALVNIFQAITTSGSYVLIVLGKVKTNAFVTWIQVVIFAIFALTALSGSEAINFTRLRLFVALVGIFLSFWLLIRAFPAVSIRELLTTSVRPLLGAAGMTVSLIFLAPYFELNLVLTLIVKIVLGVISYVTVVLSLWWLVGRPSSSAESYVIEKLRQVVFRKPAILY